MKPQEIQQLRRELKLTAKRLADELGVEPALVFDWEKGGRFPTKRHCDAMARLRAAHEPPAAPDRDRDVWTMLADPELWSIIRKVLRSPDLFDEVRRLAAAHPDPVNDQR